MNKYRKFPGGYQEIQESSTGGNGECTYVYTYTKEGKLIRTEEIKHYPDEDVQNPQTRRNLLNRLWKKFDMDSPPKN